MAKTATTSGISGGTRLTIAALLGMLLLLQFRLWFSDDGWPEVVRLTSSVEQQSLENERLAERNARLQAEVTDLKSGVAALEEVARSDLGMVGKDESFYLFVPDESQPAD